MDPKIRIKWWEPYRETLKTSLAHLREAGMLRPVFWIRVVLISTSITGLLIAAMMLAYPGLWLPWPRIIAGLMVFPPAMALVMAMTMLAPQRIEVRHDGIQFSLGQNSLRIRASDIRGIALMQNQSGLLQLTVTFEPRQGLLRTRTCIVSPDVNRDALDSLIAYLAHQATRHSPPPASKHH